MKSSLFSPENSKQLETSFNEFIQRPENKPLVEAQQKEELEQLLTLDEEMRVQTLKGQILALDSSTQKDLMPFLEYPALRRILQTFANDEERDFATWAANPQVLRMLREARAVLREGKVTNEEMEKLMIAQLQDPRHEVHEEYKEASTYKVTLPADKLVQALNEHLSERRQGNQAYNQGKIAEAINFYTRALAIVNFVAGSNPGDQEEVDRNKAAVLLNLAAAHMAEKRYGEAVKHCNEALELDPDNVNAWLRRCKAHMGRHDYQEALKDLEAASALDPYHEEVPQLRARAQMLMDKDHVKDKQVFSRMFRG